MSGGYYRLLPNDSFTSPQDESFQHRQSLLSRVSSIWSQRSSAESTESYQSHSRSRSSSLPLADSFSGLKDGRNVVLFVGNRASKRLFSIALLFILIVLSVVYADTATTILWETLFLNTPGSKCLADPLSPQSYVHWSPDTQKLSRSIYHCIRQHTPSISASNNPSKSALQARRLLPTTCIDDYFTTGAFCNDGTRTSFDIVWTWVNGSDPLLRQARQKAKPDDEVQAPEAAAAHLYRDHDELRHSMRSVLHHFRQYVSKFRLITSDFDFPVSTSWFRSQPKDSFTRDRLGLLPQWLQLEEDPENEEGPGRWKDGDVELEVIHHAELFDNYNGTLFNSLAIESQLGWLDSDTMIYFNDDFFFTADMHAADFHTSSFGPVFRLLAFPWLLVTPDQNSTRQPTGEWRTLEYTNALISNRFGERKRPYVTHVAKVVQSELMREMYSMWKEGMELTESHKFRGMGGARLPPKPPRNETALEQVKEEEEEEEWVEEPEYDDSGVEEGSEPPESSRRRRAVEEGIKEDKQIIVDPDDGGDMYVTYTFVNFVIERSREALLWSWIVAKIGGENDEWNAEHTHRAWSEIMQSVGFEKAKGVIEVVTQKRDTLRPERLEQVFSTTGDRLGATQYRFSSQDGYPYSYFDPVHGLEWWHDGSSWWPLLHDEGNFHEDVLSRPEWSRCEINWRTCFEGDDITSASSVFTRIAFEKPECGDCVIKALVSSSGPLGLSAFMPSYDKVYPPPRKTDAPKPEPLPTETGSIPPHLPLVDDWRNADFSLQSVLGSEKWAEGAFSVREWVQRLMERYRYVIGDSQYYFEIVHNPWQAHDIFSWVESNPRIALVAINDDVDKLPEETDEVMREWFEQRWSEPAAWEQPLLVIVDEEEEDGEDSYGRR